MAGKYTPGVSEVLSGVYTYIKAAASTAISAGARGVVAYPFTSDWGPVNTLLSCTIGEFEKTYNVAATTLSANKVYKHAVNGRPRRILAYRMATTDAKTATCTLDNNLKLETLYPTSRKFAVTVKDAVMEGYKTIEIVENGVVLVTTTVTVPTMYGLQTIPQK